MEDLLGSAHTTHTAPAVCLLIDTWHDPGVLLDAYTSLWDTLRVRP